MLLMISTIQAQSTSEQIQQQILTADGTAQMAE